MNEDLEAKKKLIEFLELLQSDPTMLSIWIDMLTEEVQEAEDEESV